MLGGKWRRINDKGGVFGGLVMKDGERFGKLVGIWGKRKNGDRRFFGLVLRDGEPGGAMRGTYKAHESGLGGFFRGHWSNKAGTQQGVLRGIYRHAEGTPSGQLMGMWASECEAAEPADDLAIDTDGPALCSADGMCVADMKLACLEGDCTETTDE